MISIDYWKAHRYVPLLWLRENFGFLLINDKCKLFFAKNNRDSAPRCVQVKEGEAHEPEPLGCSYFAPEVAFGQNQTNKFAVLVKIRRKEAHLLKIRERKR